MLRCSNSKELESRVESLRVWTCGLIFKWLRRSTWSETKWLKDLIKKQLIFIQVIRLKCFFRHDAFKKELSWAIYLSISWAPWACLLRSRLSCYDPRSRLGTPHVMNTNHVTLKNTARYVRWRTKRAVFAARHIE